MRSVRLWAGCCLGLLAGVVRGQEPPAPPQPPKIMIASILAVRPGEDTKLTLRGAGLDVVRSIRAEPERVATKLGSQGKSMPPKDFDAARAGDSQLEVTLKLPADLAVDSIRLIATNEAGDSPPFTLTCLALATSQLEQEPNDGFQQARPLPLGTTVIGGIHEPRNVDVYRLSVEGGKRYAIEVWAQRRGSLLDPVVTLFDPALRLIEAADDDAETIDARLVYQATTTGEIYLVVSDAHDKGGSTHGYLLHVERKK